MYFDFSSLGLFGDYGFFGMKMILLVVNEDSLIHCDVTTNYWITRLYIFPKNCYNGDVWLLSYEDNKIRFDVIADINIIRLALYSIY